MKRYVMTALAVIALAACEGAAGPTGPAGSQGPQGPAGPPGPGPSVLSATVQADAGGVASWSVPNTTVDQVVLQCWTSDSTSGPWIQIALADDPGTPSGFSACAKNQSGSNVAVIGLTEDFWYVLFIAIL